jgi:hypothetical protein
VLTVLNHCLFITVRRWCLYMFTYFLHIILLEYMTFKNTDCSIIILYIYLWLAWLGRTFFPQFNPSKLAGKSMSHFLSLTKLNLAHALYFVLRITDNKQLLLSSTSSTGCLRKGDGYQKFKNQHKHCVLTISQMPYICFGFNKPSSGGQSFTYTRHP